MRCLRKPIIICLAMLPGFAKAAEFPGSDSAYDNISEAKNATNPAELDLKEVNHRSYPSQPQSDSSRDKSSNNQSTTLNEIIAGNRSVKLDGVVYGLTPGAAIPGHTTNPNVLLRNGLKLDGNGATLLFKAGGRGLIWRPEYQVPDVKALVASDLVEGAVKIPLTTGEGATFHVGDTVVYRLTDVFYDTPETINWGFTKVTAIAGDDVYISTPIRQPFKLKGQTFNRFLIKPTILQGVYIHDLAIDGGKGAEDGIEISYGQDLVFERIQGRALGAGMIVGQYLRNVAIRDVSYEDPQINRPSYGAAFAFSESTGITISNARVANCLQGVKAEFDAHVLVDNFQFTNSRNPSSRYNIVFNAQGLSTIAANHVFVNGIGRNLLVSSTYNGVPGYQGQVTIQNLRMVLSDDPAGIPAMVSGITGELDITIAGIRSIYDATKAQWWEQRIDLKDGENLVIMGERGILASQSIYVSPGVSIGSNKQLSGVYVGREGKTGYNIAGNLSAGSETRTIENNGAGAGINWSLRDSQIQYTIITSPNSGLKQAGAFIRLRALLVSKEPMTNVPGFQALERSATLPQQKAQGSENRISIIRKEKITIPLLRAGSRYELNVPDPRVSFGDVIRAVGLSTPLTGRVISSAKISALGKAICVTIENGTNLPIEASARVNLRIIVEHVEDRVNLRNAV